MAALATLAALVGGVVFVHVPTTYNFIGRFPLPIELYSPVQEMQPYRPGRIELRESDLELVAGSGMSRPTYHNRGMVQVG